jgi:GH35 family endo-1,4-beta-xylanase
MANNIFNLRALATTHAVTFTALLFLLTLLAASCTISESAPSPNAERSQAALQRAKDNIEKYRKGPAVIRVIDGAGLPVENASLEIKQLTHKFKFGCYLKVDDVEPQNLEPYTRRFKQVFNYAVIGTFWRHMEKKKGAPDWSDFDKESALSQKLDAEIQAAPLLWGSNKYGRPDWLPVEKNELTSALKDRVTSAMIRNKQVSDWEVVNEPLSHERDEFANGTPVEYISDAFKWAREAAPNKRLMINESGVFGTPVERSYNRDRYYDLIEELLAKGTPIDIIGLQAHTKGEWYDPAMVAERLDQYSKLGKPLQISEFSAQIYSSEHSHESVKIKGGNRTGKWDAQKQAEFYREFYTVAFGHPNVDAIIAWGLDEEREWLPGVGLISEDNTPKPAFVELDKLINHEWRTNLEGKTQKDGKFGFNGYFGTYSVTAVMPDGTRVSERFDLLKGNADDWTLHLKN